MIRTLVADDSAIVRAMLCQVLSDSKNFEITGTAENGKIALEMARSLKPELIIMDINMPIMNGIEATSRIKEIYDPAIVAFTTEDTAEVGYRCLEAGAVEVDQKPNLATMDRQKIEKFCEKLMVITESFRRHHSTSRSNRKLLFEDSSTYDENEISEAGSHKDPKAELIDTAKKFSIVAIGASTGGPVAVQKVLSGLGKTFPLPVIITQHIDALFDRQFSKWLDSTTGMRVTTVCDGEILEKSHVYVAPSGCHFCIEATPNGQFRARLDYSEEIHFLRPAVDKMFSSCADQAGSNTIAVLLTGMGTDGADGCRKIYEKCGYTIAESERTSVVFGMPKAAIEMKAINRVLDLEDISGQIKKLAGACC